MSLAFLACVGAQARAVEGLNEAIWACFRALAATLREIKGLNLVGSTIASGVGRLALTVNDIDSRIRNFALFNR